MGRQCVLLALVLLSLCCSSGLVSACCVGGSGGGRAFPDLCWVVLLLGIGGAPGSPMDWFTGLTCITGDGIVVRSRGLSTLHLTRCLFGLGAAATLPHWWPTTVKGRWLPWGGALCLSAVWLLQPPGARSTCPLLLLTAVYCRPSTAPLLNREHSFRSVW